MSAPGNTFSDTSRINPDEDWELDFWCQEFEVSRAELLRAIQEVGVKSDDVERELLVNARRAERKRRNEAKALASPSWTTVSDSQGPLPDPEPA